MTIEEELKIWLNRPHKSFTESLNFAIKAWNSVEFSSLVKYETIVDWFCENIKNEYKNVDVELLNEFILLKCSSAICPSFKFIKIARALIMCFTNRNYEASSRKEIEILFTISEHENYQGSFKTTEKIYFELIDVILKSYRQYLVDKMERNEFLPEYERMFTDRVIKSLKNFVENSPQSAEFRDSFSTTCLQSLIEIFILAKTKNFQFFDDFQFIITSIYFGDSKAVFEMKTIDALLSCFPLFVILEMFECLIYKWGNTHPILELLMDIVFTRLESSEKLSDPKIYLTIASYTLNLFRKYDILLNFDISEVPVTQFINDKIKFWFATHQKEHFFEILNLICSIIKLNPLILERDIFQIATTCFIAQKTSRDWLKYEEFLILLIGMFKKLSRGERLVSNLLKSVKEHLRIKEITRSCTKRKWKRSNDPDKSMNNDDEDPELRKKARLEGNLSSSSLNVSSSEIVIDMYTQILLNDFEDYSKEKRKNGKQSTGYHKNIWRHIEFAWPAESVGVAFSHFISGLMSKPSMVIWKTLVYSLEEVLEELEISAQEGKNSTENQSFLVDFHSALICQYLYGSRLIEHADKFWQEIQTNFALTQDILKKFGKIILLNTNARMMNAFLEVCYSLEYFNLLRYYYCPDSIKSIEENFSTMEVLNTIHKCLSEDEWNKIKEIIETNSDKECKMNFNKLNLQKMYAKKLLLENTLLFSKREKKEHSLFLNMLLMEQKKLKSFLENPLNLWILDHLKKSDLIEICNSLLTEESCDFANMTYILQNRNILEMYLILLFKRLSTCFLSSKSLLGKVDFEVLLSYDSERGDEETDNIIQSLVSILKDNPKPYKIKNYSKEDVEKYISHLKTMNEKVWNLPTKTIVFTLSVILYRDLLACKEDNLSLDILSYFTDMLQFGESMEIFKYFDIHSFIHVFPISTNTLFYKLVFEKLKRATKDEINCLEKIVAILKDRGENELNENQLDLVVLLIEILSSRTEKLFKPYVETFIDIFAKELKCHFAEDLKNSKLDKQFVQRTLPAYITYLNLNILKLSKDEDIDENFRKICKIYIGHSIDCTNVYAIKLINVALSRREVLHFDPDEINLVLKLYWNQIQEYLLRNKEYNLENIDVILNMIISAKDPKEFRDILKIEDNQKDNIEYICNLYSKIFKCHLSTDKSMVLDKYFRELFFNISLTLGRNPKNGGFTNTEDVIKLLSCQKILCENTKISVTTLLIDDILSFLMDINVKNFVLDDKNKKLFNDLVMTMIEMCSALMKYRFVFIADRIPQFFYIFKDLMQSVCWYKSDRQKNITLEDEELDDLANLAHKLENLIHLSVGHGISIKRIAPYLLMFTISLMVTNQRPTTLYPKVKTHIERICYDIISICDHRVGNFILRCSNDAMRQVYENLNKEYEKYHKFKGKI